MKPPVSGGAPVPSKPSEGPTLYSLADGEGLRMELTHGTWESHPDGRGGFRPVDPTRRGTVDAPCPRCGKSLIREAGDEILLKSAVKCPEPCKGTLYGEGLRDRVTTLRKV